MKTLSVPSTTLLDKVTWGAPCIFQYGGALYDAKRFTFRLGQNAHAVIDLESIRDNMLFLRHDDAPLLGGTIGDVFNDNNQEWSTTNARIARPLPEGAYTLMAITKPSSGSRSFKLKIALAELIPYDYDLGRWAHQSDHTVLYEIKGVVPQFLQRIFAPAVEKAASAWSARASAWPWVLICTSDYWWCSSQNHENRNTDGNTLPIRVVDGSGKNIEPDGDCGGTIACVNPVLGHLANAEMLIEHPAWHSVEIEKGKLEIHRLVIWTEDIKRAKKYPDHYQYLTGALKHEFGHALGLKDLYYTHYQGKYKGYLMASENLYTPGIPTSDWAYLEQVYRNAHSSIPH